MNATERVAADWRLLVVDETQYWELPEFPGVRVECVYLFNANEHTYCCELRPSYWLVPVETRGILPDDGADMTPKEEARHEERREALANVIAENQTWDGHYRHVGSFDLARTRKVEWDSAPDTTREEEAEAVEEHCRCNSLA